MPFSRKSKLPSISTSIEENTTLTRALDVAPETKTLDVTGAKFNDDGSGGFSGYASVFGNIDSYGDIVVKGAYANTIPDFLKDGFIAWNHGWEAEPIATIKEAKEDEFGLYIDTEFHSTDFAQNIRKIVQERLARGKSMGLSIGYVADDKDMDSKGNRLLKKVSLFEVSLVNMPANRAAQVMFSKSQTNKENKSVMGVKDFPIYPDRNKSFDRPAAEGRIRAWAGAEDAPNPKYASAYIWNSGGDDPDKDGVPDHFGDYKLPIIDIVDGKPFVFAHAVFRNAVVTQGGRGGLNVPDADKEKIRSTLAGYYAKLKDQFKDDSLQAPWDRSKSQFSEEEMKAFSSDENKEIEEIEEKGISDTDNNHTQLEAIIKSVTESVLSKFGDQLSALENIDKEMKAEWSSEQVNNLPDSAFAVILPGGSKDDENKTVPRNLRKLPHHGPDGKVDLPHLRNALSRANQSETDLGSQKSKALKHLESHAEEEKMGKSIDTEHVRVGVGGLPDSAFAFITKGAIVKNGRSTEENRLFRHHDEKGNTTEELLENALHELVMNTQLSEEEKASAKVHLMKHAEDSGIDIEVKESGLVPDHFEEVVLTFVAEADNTLDRVVSLTTRAKAVQELRAKDGRQLSAANRQRLMSVRDGLTDHAQTISRLLEENDTRPAVLANTLDYSGNNNTDSSEGNKTKEIPDFLDNLESILGITIESLKKEKGSSMTKKASRPAPESDDQNDTDDKDDADDLKKILDMVEEIEDQLSDKIMEMDPSFKPEEDDDADDAKKSAAKSLRSIEIARSNVKLAMNSKSNPSRIAYLEEAREKTRIAKESVDGFINGTFNSEINTSKENNPESKINTAEIESLEIETLLRMNGVQF